MAYRLAAGIFGAAFIVSSAFSSGFGTDPEISDWDGTTSSVGNIQNIIRFHMKFEPDGDPLNGRVRVILTPEVPVTNAQDIRKAAEDAFLQTLNEPGFGETVHRIEIVVQPHEESAADSQIRRFQFATSDGKVWRIVPASANNN